MPSSTVPSSAFDDDLFVDLDVEERRRGQRGLGVDRRLAQRQCRGQVADRTAPPRREVRRRHAEARLDETQRRRVVERVAREVTAAGERRHEDARDPETEAHRAGDPRRVEGSGFTVRYSPGVPAGATGGGTWSKKPPFSS